jgi:hypothetical protein
MTDYGKSITITGKDAELLRAFAASQNGKEIYEGDVLAVVRDRGRETRCKVVFKDAEFSGECNQGFHVALFFNHKRRLYSSASSSWRLKQIS